MNMRVTRLKVRRKRSIPYANKQTVLSEYMQVFDVLSFNGLRF